MTRPALRLSSDEIDFVSYRFLCDAPLLFPVWCTPKKQQHSFEAATTFLVNAVVSESIDPGAPDF